jgi:adenosylcobinamide-GDP ribazoletransferase
VRALACAILFLTRIPLPQLTLSEDDFRASPAYFAWVGALIALLLALTAPLFAPFSSRVAALLAIVLWILVTGGLHLDGLADTIDGLSGGRGDRARALAIMRDSRIGSHGALALVLVVALKWAALDRALELERTSYLVAPIVARFGCTLLIARLPYARSEGLGSPFVGATGARALAIGVLPLLLAVVLLGWGALVASVVGVLVVAPLVLRALRTLGGLTGDVYGAAIELTEVGVLLASALPSLH